MARPTTRLRRRPRRPPTHPRPRINDRRLAVTQTSLSCRTATPSGPALQTHAPTLIAAGPWQDAEFASVRAEIDADQTWPTAPTLHAAIDHIAAANAPPQLVLLAQSHAGADDQAEVERLRRLAPLTRVI